MRTIEEDAFREVSLIDVQMEAQIRKSERRSALLTRLPAIPAMDASSGPVLADILRESAYYINLAIADASGRRGTSCGSSALGTRGKGQASSLVACP